jgi:hypothetical protein
MAAAPPKPEDIDIDEHTMELIRALSGRDYGIIDDSERSKTRFASEAEAKVRSDELTKLFEEVTVPVKNYKPTVTKFKLLFESYLRFRYNIRVEHLDIDPNTQYESDTQFLFAHKELLPISLNDDIIDQIPYARKS